MDKDLTFDERTFTYEMSQCLFSSLKIEEALHESIRFLRNYMPVDVINAGISDKDQYALRYLAVANTEAGFLVDERIRLSPEALQETRSFKLGSVRINNRVSSSKAVQEVTAHLLSAGIHFPKLRLEKGFSTMTLTIGLGKPYAAYFNLVAYNQNRFTKEHSDRLKLLERPLTGAILNLIHHRDVLSNNEKLKKANAVLRSRLGQANATHIIGAETGLKHVLTRVRQVAPTDTPVLLSGETGTGKELIAQTIHDMSHRVGNPIICINCGAIPESLVDSALFGHEKGAFTGADEIKTGYFEQADGGTIFLDEVAELPSSVQVKLLRVLQEKSFHRIGGQESISADVRIIAATHRNLESMVKKDRFRNDLLFRLNVFPIQIPPLRERKEDIPVMAKYFASTKSKEMNLSLQPVFSLEAMEQLQSYHWPGNIRELQNLIERSLIISDGSPLFFTDLIDEEVTTPSTDKLENETAPLEPLDKMIKKHIKRALFITKGKIEGPGGAASLLELKPSTLRGKIRKYKMVGLISQFKKNSNFN